MTEEADKDKPMATPSYCAWARREAAIRAAKAEAWAAIQTAYRELARAEQMAQDAYEAEMRDLRAQKLAA